MTESFGNWISLKSDEELDNKSWELKRRDSIKTRIKRLVLCTIPDSSEFETNKDYLTLRMYDIDKSLYKTTWKRKRISSSFTEKKFLCKRFG